MSKILITSALPYINDVPHLGNLIGSILSADVFARFHRSKGSQTLFICGSDEHGTTTETKAIEEGLTPKELCDKYHAIHKKIYEWFNISLDIFGRTSDATQTEITQHIFLKLHENGYIIEDFLEQTYCEKDKRFLADRFVEGTCPHCNFEDARGDQCDSCGKLLDAKDLKEPRCKLCGETPVIKKVKHLFIDLKKLQPEIESWLEKASQEGKWSRNAISIAKGWFKEGLEKRCITRDLEWGVKIPLAGWEDKRFYVWFDAPIGYISITKQLLGERYLDWWKTPQETHLYQFMGKDNVPFHTIIFPASLIGSKENWTKLHHLSSTEYLNYEDGKFSKSRRIGVFGDDVQKTNIPVDVFRYYLLSVRPETSDSKFSWEQLGEKLNSELVGTLGNLINRTLVFIQKYAHSKIEEKPLLDQQDEEFWNKIKKKEEEVATLLTSVKLRDALKVIMEIARMGNAYYQETQPWKTIKENPQKANASLYLLSHLCRDLAILVEPYMPKTSSSIFNQLEIEEKKWKDLGRLNLNGHKIGNPSHLFKKIEDKKIEELKQMFSGKKQNASVADLVDLRVAKITAVKKHPDAEKLYIEELDLGPLGKRQIISSLVPYYKEEELLGKNIIVVANLKPAKLRGELSQGMLLAAEDKDLVGVVLAPSAKPGDQVIIEDSKPTPKKELDIKEFFELNFHADNGVFLGKQELKVNNKSLLIDKNIVGKVR